MTMRILLVDDHNMFRAGARRLLQASQPEAEFAEAADGAAALERAGEFLPDVVIMDLHLPDGSGIDFSARLLARLPAARVIILSGDADLSHVDQALQHGVTGYLLKATAPEELDRAIAAVLAGKLYVCPEANAAVLERYREVLTEDRPPAKPALSGRELEVLRLVAEGFRSKEIAGRLELAVKTVETYRRRLMLKLRYASTAELVRYAIREGLVQA